jgi:hypothetical protein
MEIDHGCKEEGIEEGSGEEEGRQEGCQEEVEPSTKLRRAL